ncbi:luciferase family protein [Streptomyces sp. NPDC004539]|uniref:luciferase domain-containing protein n=1 Tax=Streptomyces sp. NPDC004539 TaxID=3154280 RepID=UPI0033A98BF9
MITVLAGWPDLAEVPASCGTGRALRSAQREIVHSHSDRHADLHLTAGVIGRLETDLVSSPAIRLVPGSQWVTIGLRTNTDIHLLMTLVSLALKTHQTCPVPGDTPSVACNDRFSASLAREAPRGQLRAAPFRQVEV